MSTRSLKKSKHFLSFLLDSNTTKVQKRYILSNTSKHQLQSIIEILYNISKNNFIKITPSTKKLFTSNLQIIKKLLSNPRKLTLSKYKLVRKYYQLVYHILFKVKDVILRALEYK